MRDLRDLSTRTKLMVAFGALVAAAILMIVLVGQQLLAIRSAAALNQESAEIVGLSHIAEKGLLRVNSQMRGTLLTGNLAYLDTYREGMVQFGTSMAALSTKVRDPEQQALVRTAIAAYRTWQRDYGDRLVGMARTPAGRARAAAILTRAGDKARITRIARMIAGVRTIEEDRVSTRQRGVGAAIATSFWLFAGGAAALLAIAGLMLWLASRWVAAPIERLTGLVERLARRDFEAVVPDALRARQDEVGRTARALEVFRTAGLANARLEEEAITAREARASDAEASAIAAREAADRDRATVRVLGEGLAAFARGDLVAPLGDGLSSDAAVLRDDFDAARRDLGGLLMRVRETVAAVDRDAEGIAAAAEQLAARTVQQASAVGVVGDRLGHVSDVIDQNTADIRRAAEVARSTRDSAARSRENVDAIVTAMRRIDDSSARIGTITQLVRAIADQTGLLTLNAQMEAARAGPAGSGFAAVAREVAALAVRLRAAAAEIGSLLEHARACAVEGVDLVDATSGQVGSILDAVGEMAMLVDTMADAADRQASDVRDVDTRMRDIADLTEHNAAMAREATAVCASLTARTAELAQSVARFRVAAG